MYALYTGNQQAEEQQRLRRENSRGGRNTTSKKIAPQKQELLPHHDPVLRRVVDSVLQESHDGSSPLQPQRSANGNSKVLRRDSYSTFTTAAETSEQAAGVLPLTIAIPSIMEPSHVGRGNDEIAMFSATLLEDLCEIGTQGDEIMFVPDDLESSDTGICSTVQPPRPVWNSGRSKTARSTVSNTKYDRTRWLKRNHTMTTSSQTSNSGRSGRSTIDSRSFDNWSNAKSATSDFKRTPHGPVPSMRSLPPRLPSLALDMQQPPSHSSKCNPGCNRFREVKKKKNRLPSSSFQVSRLEI